MKWPFTFRASGVPAPKGSMKLVRVKHRRKGVLVHDNRRTGPWSLVVGWAAKALGIRRIESEEAVAFSVVFFLPRPPSHLTAAGEPGPTATTLPVRHGTGDLDKLVRTVFDALNRIAWADDAQVAELHAWKVWANDDEEPGASITIDRVREG